MIPTVLVTGDRNWTDEAMIVRALSHFPRGTLLVHGDARGADRIAGQVAQRLGFRVQAEPADWDRYGKAAGPKRNESMLSYYEPDVVLAFHDDLRGSKGTADCVARARAKGYKVYEYSHETPY